MKTLIKDGWTNISYRENDQFVQEPIYNKFNHKIDYKLLKDFSFVPVLLSQTKQEIRWEFIDNIYVQYNQKNLETLAKLMKEIHTSNLKFPPTNHAARVKEYRRILKEKNINIPAVNDFYRDINTTLANMKIDTPLHNDFCLRNFLMNRNNKIYVVDWEYATMGDKHFDLAYFIQSDDLTEEQEQIFLNAYGDYNEIYLLRQKILVDYLIVIWAHAQDVLPFKTDHFEKRMYANKEKLEKLRNNY